MKKEEKKVISNSDLLSAKMLLVLFPEKNKQHGSAKKENKGKLKTYRVI